MDKNPANNYTDWAAGTDKPANMRALKENEIRRRSTTIMDEAMQKGLE